MDNASLEQQFDQWAASYDTDVGQEPEYPFGGYDRVLGRVAELAAITPGMAVLELGPGTGNLTARLVKAGADVWALDFSAEMLTRARAKVPTAHFAKAGLMDNYPPEFRRPFACIVSTYTFHELPAAGKLTLLRRLLTEHLAPDGHIVIGDIGFPDAAALATVQQRAGDSWDEEYYWLADETAAMLAAMNLNHHWEQMSSCGFVLYIWLETP